MLEVDSGGVYALKVNPHATDYSAGSKLDTLNRAFNRPYTMMATQLEKALTGTPKTLHIAIMDSMHELAPLAHEMMKLPIGEGSPATGRLTFTWQARLSVPRPEQA